MSIDKTAGGKESLTNWILIHAATPWRTKRMYTQKWGRLMDGESEAVTKLSNKERREFFYGTREQ